MMLALLECRTAILPINFFPQQSLFDEASGRGLLAFARSKRIQC